MGPYSKTGPPIQAMGKSHGTTSSRLSVLYSVFQKILSEHL